jgi:ParB family transcriptional regulator, chromosome partitioning protein
VLYLDRDGKVQTIHCRMPEAAKPNGPCSTGASATCADGGIDDDAAAVPKARPDLTQKSYDMIRDFRTDALHDALGREHLFESNPYGSVYDDAARMIDFFVVTAIKA